MHTILVVDDCVDTQDMLEMYLRSCGFAVEKAGDGSEAIERP
jgi:CheY-like chemotaxis protein